MCPELRVALCHLKEALRCLLHSVVFCRSLGAHNVVTPMSIYSEQLELGYVKCYSPDLSIDNLIETRINAFATLFERELAIPTHTHTNVPPSQGTAELRIGFYVPRAKRAIWGIFKPPDEKIFFEVWRIPIRVSVPSSSPPPFTRSLRSSTTAASQQTPPPPPDPQSTAGHAAAAGAAAAAVAPSSSSSSAGDATRLLEDELAMRRDAHTEVRRVLLYIIENVNKKRDHLPPPRDQQSIYWFEVSYDIRGQDGSAAWHLPSAIRSPPGRKLPYIT
ncbi:unnamed protein product [Vitrella brassicaformis CCMP3155]|uniref:Autophagy-related protein 101 n=2 Tax=Vitrella brassicaformis TaxID=1169539 RepID=A0A0G4EN17_VITBC|nr:unnamed protein product [Vitrella brassicaformis CCMP3155]|eukprot:CEL98417.1 unnamed protein product [Vitrella brassicaformis CCMP3155]